MSLGKEKRSIPSLSSKLEKTKRAKKYLARRQLKKNERRLFGTAL
jgi:hypothetical protein